MLFKFLISNKLEQFIMEKNIGIYKHTGKARKWLKISQEILMQ